MARIIVITNTGDWVAHDERVSVADLSTPHFASQLVERLAWAAADTEERTRHAVTFALRPALFEQCDPTTEGREREDKR